uniref:Uncharacterized protein n=1 Tax=Sipha flava TaxID=143950 RepID=A0A2S2Q6G2_9HEMI
MLKLVTIMCSPMTVKTIVVVALMWTTLCRSPVHCFFLSNPFNNVQSLSTFTTQPITLKVPKDQINNLKQEIQTNPMYLQQLLSQSGSPNGFGQPVSLTPNAVGGNRGIYLG